MAPLRLASASLAGSSSRPSTRQPWSEAADSRAARSAASDVMRLERVRGPVQPLLLGVVSTGPGDEQPAAAFLDQDVRVPARSVLPFLLVVLAHDRVAVLHDGHVAGDGGRDREDLLLEDRAVGAAVLV